MQETWALLQLFTKMKKKLKSFWLLVNYKKIGCLNFFVKQDLFQTGFNNVAVWHKTVSLKIDLMKNLQKSYNKLKASWICGKVTIHF
jgi:hypothetical protein